MKSIKHSIYNAIIPFLHLAAIASGHLLQLALDALLLLVLDYCISAGV